VVVLWHWAFTILRWAPEGACDEPAGVFSGLWILTWLLQVLPVFFYVGGYVHLVSWPGPVHAATTWGITCGGIPASLSYPPRSW
jgi:hypothetical protein